ncbi:hypothetical protein M2G46_22180 [Vibrio vulnificus]|uniref:hypothetical protein n=1 Tax=Vibrio cholerae TaxID=666 RepID=UPI00084D95D5|nr:hypothetical protein [Vibrio cholerae]MCU8479104.1 hypothetical protein [Vibrio vulnificus]OEG78111.1 hypothetical protein VCS12_07125 [Vibrio cholerae]
MKIEITDQFTDYFDDIWVYRSSEKQDCYMYAVHERGHTPIRHYPVLSNNYNDITTVRLMPENQCNWVLRNSLDYEQAQRYISQIASLMEVCEQINWNRAPSISFENRLKLSDLLGHTP